jgi:hypothetical protein
VSLTCTVEHLCIKRISKLIFKIFGDNLFMTKGITILFIILFLSSCSRRIITDKFIIKNQAEFKAVSQKLLLLDTSEIKVFTNKSNEMGNRIRNLKVYKAYTVKSYNKSSYSHCDEFCDSVVIFSRCGNPFWGSCEEVIYDYSINQKGFKKCSNIKGMESIKIGDSIYYRRYPAPIM